MHNALICINGMTPYNALFGRQLAILPRLEGGYIVELEASKRTGVPLHEMSRASQGDKARIREISAGNVIGVAAQKRLGQANRHKTVAPVELQGYSVGDLVDIWFDPHPKEQSGWRGPAEIAAINSDEGDITVRFQGGTVNRKHQEVTPHIAYLVFASGIVH